jgi:hypothetical protein
MALGWAVDTPLHLWPLTVVSEDKAVQSANDFSVVLWRRNHLFKRNIERLYFKEVKFLLSIY